MLKELLTERAAAAAADRRVGARGAHRGRQHPAQRLPRHLRQHPEGAGVVLGAAAQPRHAARRDAQRCSSSSEGLRYALVVHAGFKLRDAEVTRLPGDRPQRRVARSPDPRRRGVGAGSRDCCERASRRRARRAGGGDAALVQRSVAARASSPPTRRSWSAAGTGHGGADRHRRGRGDRAHAVRGRAPIWPTARPRRALSRRARRRSAGAGAPLPPLSDPGARRRRRAGAERPDHAARARRRDHRHVDGDRRRQRARGQRARAAQPASRRPRRRAPSPRTRSASRTSSWRPCRTKSARRSTRCSAGPRSCSAARSMPPMLTRALQVIDRNAVGADPAHRRHARHGADHERQAAPRDAAGRSRRHRAQPPSTSSRPTAVGQGT